MDRSDRFDTQNARIFMLRMYAYGVLGWRYQSPGMPPQALSALRAYGMLYSKSGRFASYGSIDGVGYGEQIFSLSDVTPPPARAESEGEGEYLGFGGVVLTLDNAKGYAPSFTSRTIICRDKDWLNRKTVQEMKQVGLVDNAFEDRFEVYGSDQIEARALITPDFMERLMQLDDDYLGRNVQCAFLGGKFNICLEIDDRFDFNGLRIVETYAATRAIVLHELAAVFTVLELGQRLQNTIGVQTNETMDKERGVYYAKQLDIVKAALDTPPENWLEMPDIDPDMRYSHYLFDGYLGQMVKSVYAPLAPPKSENSKDTD